VTILLPGRLRLAIAVIKGWAWWWVGILVAFFFVVAITGNGREAWSIVLYANLALFGLLALAAFINGFFEVRERRRDGKRDDSSHGP
jgi:hypothetical protein